MAGTIADRGATVFSWSLALPIKFGAEMHRSYDGAHRREIRLFGRLAIIHFAFWLTPEDMRRHAGVHYVPQLLQRIDSLNAGTKASGLETYGAI